MRPLPILDDLAEQPPVYDPAADDLTVLLGSDLGAFDSLQALLEGDTNSTIAQQDSIGSTLDTIGSIVEDLDAVFSTLHGSYSDLDMTGTIAEVAGFDAAFDSGSSSWAPDFTAGIAAFGDFAYTIITAITDFVVYIFNALLQLILSLVEYVIGLIYSLLAGILGF